jgi:Gram-negative bacterial TonB protein C-terminal
MFRFWLSLATSSIALGTLFAAEVEVKPKGTATPPKSVVSPSVQPAASASSSPLPIGSATPASAFVGLPQFRPVLLGLGPNSLINRMDGAGLIRDGQYDASLYFRCAVGPTGDILNVAVYHASPDSNLLERELIRCLDQSVFVPAVYEHQPVAAFFFGTVDFKVVNRRPRLRIFANQEPAELQKESDFIGPQLFIGPGSQFHGLHYPPDSATASLTGLVEVGLKIDATGKVKELKVVSEYPPLLHFREAAEADFRGVTTFIPAFRDGKPVECDVTLPIYYEP